MEGLWAKVSLGGIPCPPNPAPPHTSLLALLPFQLRDGTSVKTQSDGWCEEGSWKVRYGRGKYWGKRMLGGRMLGEKMLAHKGNSEFNLRCCFSGALCFSLKTNFS